MFSWLKEHTYISTFTSPFAPPVCQQYWHWPIFSEFGGCGLVYDHAQRSDDKTCSRLPTCLLFVGRLITHFFCVPLTNTFATTLPGFQLHVWCDQHTSSTVPHRSNLQNVQLHHQQLPFSSVPSFHVNTPPPRHQPARQTVFGHLPTTFLSFLQSVFQQQTTHRSLCCRRTVGGSVVVGVERSSPTQSSLGCYSLRTMVRPLPTFCKNMGRIRNQCDWC